MEGKLGKFIFLELLFEGETSSSSVSPTDDVSWPCHSPVVFLSEVGNSLKNYPMQYVDWGLDDKI